MKKEIFDILEENLNESQYEYLCAYKEVQGEQTIFKAIENAIQDVVSSKIKGRKKTKYRTISNGYFKFLQYEKEVEFLFFKWKVWSYVFRPYYHRITGRNNFIHRNEYKCYVNSFEDNLINFVERYPYIDEYFEYAYKRQSELELEAKEYNSKLNSQKNKVHYFE